MNIDRTHRAWFIGSVVGLTIGAACYVPYGFFSVTGASGGSIAGLIYASLGSSMMLFAGLLGLRKKFPIWRVGRATTWMRGHLWLGFLSFPFILFHSGFQFGNGLLTRILMILFFVVFVSGLAGALLQHYIPKLMTQRVSMETIYEQIDRIIGQLVVDAGMLSTDLCAELDRELEKNGDEKLERGDRTSLAPTLDASGERASQKIAKFFGSQIEPYLLTQSPRKHPLNDPAQASLEFQQLKVLVPKALWPKLDDLEAICEEKRQLERQRRLHVFLHGWLLFHVPASYGLLLLGAVHAVMALRY